MAKRVWIRTSPHREERLEQQNALLVERVQALRAELEAERSRRVEAERGVAHLQAALKDMWVMCKRRLIAAGLEEE